MASPPDTSSVTQYPDLRPHKTEHYAAVPDPKEVVGLLRAIEGYGGQPPSLR